MSMGEHFLQWINIVDFKCFHNFEAKDFKRVNLISGKNNVGKTAFMEACFLVNQLKNDFYSFISALVTIENIRKPIGNIDEFKLLKLIQKRCPLELSHPNGNSVKLEFIENKINFSLIAPDTNLSEKSFDDIKNPALYTQILTNFIPNMNLDTQHLKMLYDGVKRSRRRDELNQFVNNFDNDLVEVDVIDDEFQIFSKSLNNWMDISEYGDGIKHYIAIICAIWTYPNKIIFIDEIENGIHYTHLDQLWELILTISKEQNVQVFATTHSKECIESYARIAKKLEDEEIAFVELGRNDANELKAMVYPYSWFIDSIEQHQEVRGW
jgi:AAA15 family ATPase/GTPase